MRKELATEDLISLAVAEWGKQNTLCQCCRRSLTPYRLLNCRELGPLPRPSVDHWVHRVTVVDFIKGYQRQLREFVKSCHKSELSKPFKLATVAEQVWQNWRSPLFVDECYHPEHHGLPPIFPSFGPSNRCDGFLSSLFLLLLF